MQNPESERRLSSVTYRNQASGSLHNPLGLDTSLVSTGSTQVAPTRPALAGFLLNEWHERAMEQLAMTPERGGGHDVIEPYAGFHR